MTVISPEHQIISVTLKSAGWPLGAYLDSDLVHSHHFYIRDFRTDLMVLLAINQDVFAKIAGAKSPERTSAAVAELMMAYDERCGESEYLSALGLAVAEYLKGTRTFSAWQCQSAQNARGHFCINLYGAGKHTSVRPFALVGDPLTLILDAEQVMHDSLYVKQHDAVNHPEWFC